MGNDVTMFKVNFSYFVNIRLLFTSRLHLFYVNARFHLLV